MRPSHVHSIALVLSTFALLLPTTPLSAAEVKDDLFPFLRAGRIGVMKNDGTIVAPAAYDFPVSYSHDGLEPCYTAALRVTHEDWLAILDQNTALGNRATVYFDEAECFPPANAECCLVSKNSKLGFVFPNGAVLHPTYDAASLFWRGYAWVRTGRAFSVIDRNGNPMSGSFDRVECLSDTTYRVCRNGRWGIVSNGGKTLVPPTREYRDLDESARPDWPRDARADQRYPCTTHIRDAWFIEHRDGRRIPLPDVKSADRFSAGLAVVKAGNGLYGAVDAEGRFVLQAEFTKLYFFQHVTPDGVPKTAHSVAVAAAETASGCGLIDSQGNWILAPRYSSIDVISEDGLRYATSPDGIGRLSPLGDQVVPCRYDYLGEFRGGLALGCHDAATDLAGNVMAGTWEYVNIRGQVVRPRSGSKD